MEYKSRVYTERPAYADFDSAQKFMAIQGIIARRLKEHPRAICSYSGGADSDILIHLIEQTRKIFNLPSINYVFFNTGLEMKAIKDHVKATAEKYGVEIRECRPKINIVTASRKYGLPFVSKIMSAGLEGWQKKNIPLSIAEEYDAAEDKAAKRAELKERYPGCETTINFCAAAIAKASRVRTFRLLSTQANTCVTSSGSTRRTFRYLQSAVTTVKSRSHIRCRRTMT